MRLLIRLLIVVALVAGPLSLFGQSANGKLQLHFMDVGQGDGALLISPLGETVLFDDGVRNECDKPLSYLQQVGITRVDYHVTSHYHDDHIGCAKDVLDEFPLNKLAFDRGGSYNSATFRKYVTKVGAKRRTATAGQMLTLDSGSPNPVAIEFVALNGASVSTINENDLSLVAVVRFGAFDAEIAGDLSGFRDLDYEDIETPVAPQVGQVEVYKVHHHGSRYSSNAAWLSTVKPRIGIISAGENSKHGHPTAEAAERLHQANVRLYWTTNGGGVEPDPDFDVVGGNIIMEVAPAAQVFTVRHTAGSQAVEQFPMWGATGSPGPAMPVYSWSRHSSIYHHSSCRYVSNISPENLVTGSVTPQGKSLHANCPR